MEAIVLAGGFGTRLRSVVNDVPKPMANVNGKPFLQYVFDWLYEQKISRVVLAVGYKYEKIQCYFGNDYQGMELVYSIESEPLGTGGALKQAFDKCRDDFVIVTNGDTLFLVDLLELEKHYNGCVTLVYQYCQNARRYGYIDFNGEQIVGFREKNIEVGGYINGGVYMINRQIFINYDGKFSFEEDVLPVLIKNGMVTGIKSDAYFIDIGIPEDYARANCEL